MYIGNSNFNLDLAGRFRTSEKETIFSHSPKSAKNHVFIESLTGSGTSTLNYDESTVSMTCTTASGDKVTRQSHIYCPYLEGTPVLYKGTGIFASTKANVAQRVGMFDDLNGLFFEDNGTNMGVVRRTSTSGSVVNNRVAQASWNIDPLDGTGPSGLTVSSWNFLILFEIQYLWQGAIGAVWGIRKMSYDSGYLWSEFIPVHYYSAFDNSLTVPFIGKPSLPARYEIENTGTAASSTTLKQCCVDVVGEGGHRLVGSDWGIDNFAAPRTLSATTEVPILGIRLADTFNSEPNRRMLKYLQANAYSSAEECDFRIKVIHQPTSTTGGTWTDIDATHSGAQYNTGLTAVTGGDVHQVDAFTVYAGGSGAGTTGSSGSSSGRFEDSHSLAVQNIASNKSDLIVIYALPHGTTSTDIRTSIKFLEFE
jgi:hypothetical protein